MKGSVKGIGGIFIESEDAARLAGWYADVLNIQLEAHPDGIGYFYVFYTRDAESGMVRENPVFAINQAHRQLPPPDERGYTLNLRVDGLNALLDRLRARGVEVEPDLLEWSRGRHAWIRDGDGNRVELYEEIFPDG